MVHLAVALAHCLPDGQALREASRGLTLALTGLLGDTVGVASSGASAGLEVVEVLGLRGSNANGDESHGGDEDLL